DGVPSAESSDSFARSVRDRLKATGVHLGLLLLRLDMGLTKEARATLAGLQQDFQLLLHGVEAQAGLATAQAPTQPPKRQKALLVEDDCNQRELLAGFLRHSGFEVDTAGDGSDALDYLSS